MSRRRAARARPFRIERAQTVMRPRDHVFEFFADAPLGPLGALARALFVGRSLERIFDFRRRAVAAIFGS